MVFFKPLACQIRVLRQSLHRVPDFSGHATRRNQGITFSQPVVADPFPTPGFLCPATNSLSSSEFPLSFFPLPVTRGINVEKSSPNPPGTAIFGFVRISKNKPFTPPQPRREPFTFPNRQLALEDRQCLKSTNFPRIFSAPSFLDLPPFSATRENKTFPSQSRSRHVAMSSCHLPPSVISVSFSSVCSVSLFPGNNQLASAHRFA